MACECSIPKVMKGPVLMCGEVTELLRNELAAQGVPEAGFPFWTALGLIYVESGGFHICARSPSCDYGLVQMNAVCPACLAETSPYNNPPEECFNPDDHEASRIWYDPKAAVWCLIGHYKVKGGARGWTPWAAYTGGYANTQGERLRSRYCEVCNVPGAGCGTPLPVPSRGCIEGCTKTYSVQPGDTFAAIASRNLMTVQELANLNPQITDPNLIYKGDCICLSTAPVILPPTPGEIAGLVWDRETGFPITGATVSVAGQTPGADSYKQEMTFTDGVYRFELSPGSYKFKANAEGYQGWENLVTISEGARLTLDVGLIRVASLPPPGELPPRPPFPAPIPPPVGPPAFALRNASVTGVG